MAEIQPKLHPPLLRLRGRARDRACPRKSGENARSEIQHPRFPRCGARARLGATPVVTARIDRFIAEDGKGPYPDMEWAGLGVQGSAGCQPVGFG